MKKNYKFDQITIALFCFIFIFGNISVSQIRFAEAQVASSSEINTIVQASSSVSEIASSTIVAAPNKATSSVMLSGKASWYNFKGGLFAASPDFPIGSVLRVISTANPQKRVDVVVNDWGPDRIKHPERVIDLDKQAFSQLASLGAGVISVRIEPIMIATSSNRVNPVAWSASSAVALKTDIQTNNNLKLTSAAGIVIESKTGKVLWQKNPKAQMPLASLTKIVAIKVFMDTKPKLNKIVAYKKIDEQRTYEWADAGLVAKLHVKEGETMSIEDLLNAALLGSANNSIESLVRVSGLTRTQFIKRMNTYVRQVGAVNTSFVEPTGLSPQNVSSVKDYAIISRKALANPVITKITSSKKYTFVTRNTKQPHLINNTNKLMSWSNLNITGSKTGYLEEAKYCLMTKSKSSKGEVIAVTFGTPAQAASFNETKQLIEYGFKKL